MKYKQMNNEGYEIGIVRTNPDNYRDLTSG
jgi:hypothetical protein